jgi:hypothetical protein
MVKRSIGLLLLAFVVLGPALVAGVRGDAVLALLILVTTVLTLALGVAGSWLIVKSSPPPKEWEKR